MSFGREVKLLSPRDRLNKKQTHAITKTKNRKTKFVRPLKAPERNEDKEFKRNSGKKQKRKKRRKIWWKKKRTKIFKRRETILTEICEALVKERTKKHKYQATRIVKNKETNIALTSFE